MDQQKLAGALLDGVIFLGYLHYTYTKYIIFLNMYAL